MAIVINTNVSSLQAQKNLSSSQSHLQTSFNRLSSGYRINSASDDAAGLAVSESLKKIIRGADAAEGSDAASTLITETATPPAADRVTISNEARDRGREAK